MLEQPSLAEVALDTDKAAVVVAVAVEVVAAVVEIAVEVHNSYCCSHCYSHYCYSSPAVAVGSAVADTAAPN